MTARVADVSAPTLRAAPAIKFPFHARLRVQRSKINLRWDT
jgi:hypothetical protein